jgi:hypothetical protein
MDKSDAIGEVILDHFDLSVDEEVSPTEDLDFSEPNDQLFDQHDFLVAGVQVLTGVGLPLVKFFEEKLHAGEHFHQRGDFGIERDHHVVRDE